ncbi:PSP1 C-terminal domain-containing protein, partial [Streptobacillus moniliformis]
ADGRLDFRDLVKEVNKAFNKRVEFYQIKYNDEGRLLNAFGKYGREIYW